MGSAEQVWVSTGDLYPMSGHILTVGWGASFGSDYRGDQKVSNCRDHVKSLYRVPHLMAYGSISRVWNPATAMLTRVDHLK